MMSKLVRLLFIAICTLTIGLLLEATAFSTEAGHTSGTATTIDLSDRVFYFDHNPANNHDWYRFTIESTSYFYFYCALQGTSEGDVVLYDSNMEAVVPDSIYVGSSFQLIRNYCDENPISAGEYFLRASSATHSGSYTMILTETACVSEEVSEVSEDSTITKDSYEPDDEDSQATSLIAGTAQTHNISPVGDEDWFSFVLTETSSVIIETSADTGDTRMWLYDDDLTEVEYDDDDGESLRSRIDRVCDVNALSAGTYYVLIDEYGSNGEIESYDITLTTASCGSPESEKIYVDENGNVGIGTKKPGENKLAVNGTIKAKELLVDSSGWANFVFEKGYPLLKLRELEEFINTKNHLPGIPSSGRVAENGINVAQMQARLLQKIEELTLYVIRLNKRTEMLKSNCKCWKRSQRKKPEVLIESN